MNLSMIVSVSVSVSVSELLSLGIECSPRLTYITLSLVPIGGEQYYPL